MRALIDTCIVGLALAVATSGCGRDTRGDLAPVEPPARTVATLEQEQRDATIELDRGIAGVELDMRRQEVVDRLGSDPVLEQRDETELGSFVTMRYEGIEAVLDAETERVISVGTTRRIDLTPQGVGPGSSEEELHTAYPRVECDDGPDPRICRLQRTDAVVNDFFVSGGIVTSIVIGHLRD